MHYHSQFTSHLHLPPYTVMPLFISEHTSQVEASSYYTAVGMACLFAFLFLFAVIVATFLVVAIVIIRKKATSVFAADLEPILQQGKLLIKNNIYTTMHLTFGQEHYIIDLMGIILVPVVSFAQALILQT